MRMGSEQKFLMKYIITVSDRGFLQEKDQNYQIKYLI